jgi:16S rRNA (guanine527-N7)-methyltransferase
MTRDEISELLAPFTGERLADRQLTAVSSYLDLLLTWNRRVNLTAVRDPRDIMTRHFGESLFGARTLFPRNSEDVVAGPALKLVDVGSGAGFPGLAIKIFAPEVRINLIESHQKKATFLREVTRSLALANTEVFAGRAEDFPTREADVVTLRAVEKFEVALPVAVALVRSGGRLALWIGESQVEKARALVPWLRWDSPVRIPQSESRVLLVGIDNER